MEDKEKEFHIDLARIGMRYGARVSTALAVFAIGGGLLFTTGGELFSEHNAFLALGTSISSFILIGSGMVIMQWSGSKSHEEIAKLKKKHMIETEKIQQKNISCKNCFILFWRCEMYDGLIHASNIEKIKGKIIKSF